MCSCGGGEAAGGQAGRSSCSGGEDGAADVGRPARRQARAGDQSAIFASTCRLDASQHFAAELDAKGGWASRNHGG